MSQTSSTVPVNQCEKVRGVCLDPLLNSLCVYLTGFMAPTGAM